MSRPTNSTLSDELVQLLAEQGFDALPELLRVVLNAAMQAARHQSLRAAPYERTEERRGYANGYKSKTVPTRAGQFTRAVPQVRDGRFYPSALEKGLRSERALRLALAEMYVQGVSTRKVAAMTEQLCGVELTSMQVSRAAVQLDAVLDKWRSRPLGLTPYGYLDARYEKVRLDGQVRDAAVLIAMGVGADGKRSILGVSVAVSEQELHWRTFLQSLVERGLSGVELVISAAHAGLQAARTAVVGGVAWQRCQFHLQHNAPALVPRVDLKSAVAKDIRAIFNAHNRAAADALLAQTVQKYAKSASKLASWLEIAIPEGLTGLSFPEAHRVRLRTTNGLERLNQELRRRTRVVGVFPNEASCLRLVSALAMETRDEWETGKVYVSLTA